MLHLHACWMTSGFEPGATGWSAGAQTARLSAQVLRGETHQHDNNKVLWHTTPEFIQ